MIPRATFLLLLCLLWQAAAFPGVRVAQRADGSAFTTACQMTCCDSLSGAACCCYSAPDESGEPAPALPAPSSGGREWQPVLSCHELPAWAVVECLSSKNEARHLPDAADARPKRPHVRLVVLFESLLM